MVFAYYFEMPLQAIIIPSFFADFLHQVLNLYLGATIEPNKNLRFLNNLGWTIQLILHTAKRTCVTCVANERLQLGPHYYRSRR